MNTIKLRLNVAVNHKALTSLLLILKFSLLLSLLPSYTLAQTSDIAVTNNEALNQESPQERKSRLQDFYVVDFVLFAQRDTSLVPPAGSVKAEQWSKTLNLPTSENALSLSNQGISSIYPELSMDAKLLGQTSPSTSEPETSPSQSTQTRSPYLPLLDQRFSQIPDEVRKIKQVRRYQLLSHQTWLQRIEAKNQAVPVTIQSPVTISSDSTQKAELLLTPNTPLVQGHIRLHKSRYLHLKTDLIATEFLSSDELQAKVNDEQNATNLSRVQANEDKSLVENQNSSLTESTIESTAESADASLSIKNTSQELPWPSIKLNAFYANVEHAKVLQTLSPDELEQLLSIPSNTIKSIAPLSQQRKMRSREMHYIDHPKVGILIYITPLYKVLDNL